MQTFKLKNKEPTMGLKVENIFDKVILFLHILSSNDKSLIIYAFYIYIYIYGLLWDGSDCSDQCSSVVFYAI